VFTCYTHSCRQGCKYIIIKGLFQPVLLSSLPLTNGFWWHGSILPEGNALFKIMHNSILVPTFGKVLRMFQKSSFRKRKLLIQDIVESKRARLHEGLTPTLYRYQLKTQKYFWQVERCLSKHSFAEHQESILCPSRLS
jgi:hypothetical protein